MLRNVARPISTVIERTCPSATASAAETIPPLVSIVNVRRRV